MIHRAIVINPFEKTVRIVHSDFSDLRVIYATIQSRDMGHLSLVASGENSPAVSSYHDDMGAYRKGQQWFMLGNFPSPLCGVHVLCGINREGDTVDVPFLSSGTIESVLKWITPEEAHAQFKGMTITGAEGTTYFPFTGFETMTPAEYKDVTH